MDLAQAFTLLTELARWPGPLYLFLGITLGMLFGVLPGLGAGLCLALLLPLTFGIPVDYAIMLLIGAMGAVPFGGSISAILVNTPGTNQNIATTFDGYPLSQQGRAGYALGASATSSALGALVGAIVLTLILPVGRYLVLAFSFPDYFMMILVGLCFIIVMSRESLLKGLIAAILGFLFSTVGSDPITGLPRFTFGVIYLWDGINIIAALVGIFAVAELVHIFLKKETIAKKETFRGGLRDTLEGCKVVFKHLRVFFQSSVIGVFIGMIPGVGASVSNVIAYFTAKETIKEQNKFGQGDIRGVIAPESANNATEGGALVPTLIFGIPGGIATVVLLSALMLHGITTGPRLMLDHPDLIIVLIYTLVISNLAAALIGLVLANFLSRVTITPPAVLVPITLTIALMGVYAMRGAEGDVIVSLCFGALGYIMKRLDYPRIPLIIALLLGGLAQKNFFQTLILSGFKGFFTRPISICFFIIALVLLISSLKGVRLVKQYEK